MSHPVRHSAASSEPEDRGSADVTAMDPAISTERSVATIGGARGGVLEYATQEHAPSRVTIHTVLKLALPTLAEQLLMAVIGLTDTIIAGHTGDTPGQIAAASAAVGTMAYIQWFSGLMNAALGVGATAIVARSIGARRPRVANRVAGTSVCSAFVIGLGVALSLFVFAPGVVWACGLRDLAAQFAITYMRIMCITICLQAAAQIGMACLRGAGDTMRPMFITGGVMIVNGFFSSAFTFGWLGAPRWGVAGNAFGTMLAFLLSGIATLIMLMGGSAGIKLGLRHLRIVPHVLWRVLRIGLPSWFEGLLLWVGQFAIVVLVINRNDAAVAQLKGGEAMGGVTMAAHNAVLRIESIAFLPGFGFGIAASALVGQMLGARRPQDARQAAFLTNRLAFLTMTLAAVPMVLFPRFLLRILVKSEPVVEVGYWPMILAGLAQPGFSIAITMGSALKGAGETVLPMFSTIAGIFLIRVPVLMLALWYFTRIGHAEWGLIAVWIGILTDLNFRAGTNLLGFLRGGWMRKKV